MTNTNKRNSTLVDVVIILLVLFACLLAPMWIQYRNPPFHYYGGFNFGLWYEGMAFSCCALAVIIILRIKQLANRYVSLISILVLVAITTWLSLMLRVAMMRPTV